MNLLSGTSSGLTGAVATLQLELTTLQSTVAALPTVRNGIGAPANSLGNVNDWYADTGSLHIYVKTAPTVWTLIV